MARLALTSLESGFHLYIKVAILGQNQDPAIQLSCLQHGSSGTTPANLASTVFLASKFHTLNMHFVQYLQLREVVFEYQSAGSLIPLSLCNPSVPPLLDNHHCIEHPSLLPLHYWHGTLTAFLQDVACVTAKQLPSNTAILIGRLTWNSESSLGKVRGKF